MRPAAQLSVVAVRGHWPHGPRGDNDQSDARRSHSFETRLGLLRMRRWYVLRIPRDHLWSPVTEQAPPADRGISAISIVGVKVEF